MNWRRALRSREFLMLLMLLGLCAVIATLCQQDSGNTFLSHYNLRNLLRRVALLAIVGIGQTFVIITGGIDLSVGSLIAFTGVLIAVLASPDHTGWPLSGAICAALAVCMGVGLLHGLFVSKLRVPPFVVTLASLCILRGAAMVLTNAVPVTILHDTFPRLGNGSVFLGAPAYKSGHDLALGLPLPAWLDMGVPIPALICALILALTTVVMTYTVWGRYLYAVGGNAETARLSGVPVERMVCAAYVASSLLAGVTGVLFAAYNGQGNPADATAYELNAIAAAVIGGASLTGGVGSMGGAVIGAGVLHTILNGLGLAIKRDASLWEGVVVGVVLLSAVTAAVLLRRERAQV